MHKLALRFACLAALLLVACATRYVAPGQVERSVFSQPVEVTQMRAAIIQVLNARRHQVVGESGATITTTLSGGGRDLTVRVDYGTLGFELTPVGMSGFETRGTAGAGTEQVSDRYKVWMHRLRVLIDRQLAELRQQEVDQREQAELRAVRVAQANQQAEEAALERERLRTIPSYAAQPAYGAQPGYVAAGSLRPGFNVTRPPNGLGELSLVVINQSAEALHGLTLRTRGAPAWLPNQLSRTIEPGQTYTLTGISAGYWEVRVQTLRAFKEWHDLQFGAGGEYTVLVTTDGWTWL
jgi:hypothetical protein